MCADRGAEALLTLWESVHGAPAALRGDALLQAAVPEAGQGRILGCRNADLMELHAHLFGREIELLSHCPECATAAHFSSDCVALAARLRPAADAALPARLEAHGYELEFRMVEGADVASASGADGDFVGHLLQRCVLACTCDGAPVLLHAIPAEVFDALSQRMDTLDPGASVSFALACPQCGACWQAPLDVGDMMWQKVRAAAERVLLEIDLLARAYGWTEDAVLRLTPLRRAAYLQMVTS